MGKKVTGKSNSRKPTPGTAKSSGGWHVFFGAIQAISAAAIAIMAIYAVFFSDFSELVEYELRSGLVDAKKELANLEKEKRALQKETAGIQERLKVSQIESQKYFETIKKQVINNYRQQVRSDLSLVRRPIQQAIDFKAFSDWAEYSAQLSKANKESRDAHQAALKADLEWVSEYNRARLAAFAKREDQAAVVKGFRPRPTIPAESGVPDFIRKIFNFNGRRIPDHWVFYSQMVFDTEQFSTDASDIKLRYLEDLKQKVSERLITGKTLFIGNSRSLESDVLLPKHRRTLVGKLYEFVALNEDAFEKPISFDLNAFSSEEILERTAKTRMLNISRVEKLLNELIKELNNSPQ